MEDAKTPVKNIVRPWITHVATIYTFGGALLLGGACFLPEAVVPAVRVELALDVYLSILPTATLVIGFWFRTSNNS